jgi:hypothetical protein
MAIIPGCDPSQSRLTTLVPLGGGGCIGKKRQQPGTRSLRPRCFRNVETAMAFSTTSFFAGVGTVFAAVTIGFAGGALLTTSSPKMEPNRLERVAASNPPTVAATKAETPAVPSVPTIKAEAPAVPAVPVAKVEAPPVPAVQAAARNETAETTAMPDRVVAMTPAPASPQVAPAQPQPPVVARKDMASLIDNAKRLRETELRKQADLRESERRAEQRRRKRQEIDAAVDAVRRMKRDGVLQEAAQQDEAPRFGFFGHD